MIDHPNMRMGAGNAGNLPVFLKPEHDCIPRSRFLPSLPLDQEKLSIYLNRARDCQADSISEVARPKDDLLCLDLSRKETVPMRTTKSRDLNPFGIDRIFAEEKSS